MSTSKKKRDEAKRRLQRQSARRGLSDTMNARFVKPNIHREIRCITGLAQAEDSRIVSVGKLVLFSTHSRDAWLLDPEDNFAVCLCRAGDPQPFRIVDAPQTFAIEWSAQFEIDGPTFIVEERSGKIVEINGYPTAEISAACRALMGEANS